MMTIPELVNEIGDTVLYVNLPTASDSQLVQVGKTARSLGYKSICLKKADGGDKYYSSRGQLQTTKQTVNEQSGCGCFFFHYCYGYALGNGVAQLEMEAAIAQDLAFAEGHGVVCSDMEVEYNGQPGAAAQFASLVMGGANNPLNAWIVTTWADPIQQNWEGVISELAPHIAALNPQQYTSWLLGQEWQLASVEGKVLPAVNIWNDALQGAQQARQKGHKGLWCWEETGSFGNPSLTRSMIATFRG